MRSYKKGSTYGTLTIIKEAEPKIFGGNRKFRQMLCHCSACGKKAIVSITMLISNNPSCGCLTKRNHPYYAIYRAMLHRCYNKKNLRYDSYGGRGIKVCKRWREGSKDIEGFWFFVEDMGEKPQETYSLDRIDNDGNYSPKNCKWSSLSDQQRNKTDTNYTIYKNKKVPVIDLYRKLKPKVKWQAFKTRIEHGWSIEDAVNKPSLHYNKI